MRHVITAVAALAVCGLFSIAPASANDLGGPVKKGNMCWAGTDGSGGIYGYWRGCPKTASAKPAKKKKMKS